jgi:hypothetical protein
MLIQGFKTPKQFFDFRRIVFLILQEGLDKFADAVIHEKRHEFDGYISVRLNEKTKHDFLPDQNLVFMTDWHYKEYCEWEARCRQARIAEMDKEDEEHEEQEEEDADASGEASEETKEEEESEGDRIARLSMHRFADRLARWVEDNTLDGSFEVQAYPRSRSFVLDAPIVDDDGSIVEGDHVAVRISVQEFDDSNTDVSEQRELETQVAVLKGELVKLREQLGSAESA